jgi:ribosomal protein S16
MRLRSSSSSWAYRLTLAGAAAVTVAAPAFADRPLMLSSAESQGFARITAKWGDGDEKAPNIKATIEGDDRVLILRFDQKITVNLDALKQGLPSWAAATRLDADGMTARIALRQPSRLRTSNSVDLTAIDVLPKDSKAAPPGVVSPLAAKKAQEAAAQKAAAVAAAAPPMEDLEVRGSHADRSSRITFYWPGKVSYKVLSQSDGQLKLQFNKRAKADLAYLHIDPPANLARFDAENTPAGYVATITSKDKMPIRHFFDGDTVVIDITKPKTPEELAADAAAVAKAADKPKVQPAAAKAEDKPILLAPPKALLQSEAEAAAELTKRTEEDAKIAADATLGGPERVTDLASSWSDPAPRSGVIDVKISPLASGMQLQLPFLAPTPAAVFQRNGATWAVFAANADLKVDPVQLPAGYKVRAMRSKNAAILRIEAPRGVTVSADWAETSWTIRLAPTAIPPQRFIKPEHKADGSRGRIETLLPSAAGLVWFEDTATGDQIAAAVSYGPSSASPTPRDFVEASLPATAHGIAIIPKSDDAVVTIERERVIVSMQAGAQTLPVAEDDKKPKGPVNPALIDFKAWGKDVGKTFYERRAALEKAVTETDPATVESSKVKMELARFYLGHEMAPEALGILNLAADERPDLRQDAVWLGMHGAANYLAHRLTEAETDLSKGPLRGQASAALWRGAVASERGDWEQAGEFFREAGDQIYSYTPQRAAAFAASWAEAAVNTNDYDVARRQAEQAVANGEREVKERGQLVLAKLTSVIDGPAAAYDEFARLSKEALEPNAVKAELKRLELGVSSGRMTANDAAGELDSLRYRWRGDGIEMATVGILADQYMRVGRFREALMLAQSTALRDTKAPGSRELRIRLSDYFRRLFLNGEADRLDPIQALALFYEFADDLIPIGADGDQMTRKLAQRLVAFDLLEPAAQLLQHQVDNRMRGIGKAAVAIDLATIYLWDKRPDRALAAINNTRQPALPKDLALERRLLEAAAYRDLGRYDHVIELVEPLEGMEARSLMADAYWRDRQWPEASRVFISMLPKPGDAQAKDADIALKAAIAARMARDAALIAQLRAYAPVFAGNPNKASFDLITAQTDISGAALSEAVKRLADAPTVDAFAAAMKKRFEASKVAAAPAVPAAVPAAATPAAPKPTAPAAKPPATAAAAPAEKKPAEEHAENGAPPAAGGQH